MFHPSSFCLPARGQYSIDRSTIDGGGGTSIGGVYSVTGTVKNVAGTISVRHVMESSPEDATAWHAEMRHDSVNDALTVWVRGDTVHGAIRWVATVRTTEIVF